MIVGAEPMSVLIRNPQPDEKDIFVHLYSQLLEFNRKNNPPDENFEQNLIARKEMAKNLFDQQDHHHLILLAFIDEEPVGFIRAHIYQPDYTTDLVEDWAGNIDELFVRQGFRGNNIGQLLITEAEEWMKENGVNHVTLQMYSWNDRAGEFYEKQGFEVLDIRLKKEIT